MHPPSKLCSPSEPLTVSGLRHHHFVSQHLKENQNYILLRWNTYNQLLYHSFVTLIFRVEWFFRATLITRVSKLEAEFDPNSSLFLGKHWQCRHTSTQLGVLNRKHQIKEYSLEFFRCGCSCLNEVCSASDTAFRNPFTINDNGQSLSADSVHISTDPLL